MIRNYEGEKLQKKFFEKCLIESMKIDSSEYNKEDVILWDNDVWKYVSWKFKNEKKGRSLNTRNMADYISGIAFRGIPFECYIMLEKKEEWGYTTDDEIWCDRWFTHIAAYIIRELDKRGL